MHNNGTKKMLYRRGPEPKVLTYDGRIQRIMELARRVAYNSELNDFRHGAVLVKGHNVINTSFNKNSFCSFGSRFRQMEGLRGNATVHAEIGAILGLDRSITEGSTVYVCRIGRDGEFRLSRPCAMCYQAMKHVGVRKVVWSIDPETCGCYKI